ncbi:MAG: hypothetical protein AAF845_12230 [Bacteroidota bacterium]
MLRLSLAAVLLVSLAACDDEPVDPAQVEVVPEADVARLKAEVFLATRDLDAAIARLEADVAEADSAVQAAYMPVLDRLREDRRRFQVRVDTLRPIPRAAFDSTQADIEAAREALGQAVARARVEGAPDVAALQTALNRALGRLDARLGAIAPAADADTTDVLRVALDSIRADRARLTARLGAYPDTSDAQFAPFRSRITDALIDLETRTEAVAPDTVGVGRGT